MRSIIALPPRIVAPARVALAVFGVSGAGLALLAAGDATGWLPHAANAAFLGVAAWIALFLAGWTLMTCVMMLPSSLPFLLTVQRAGGPDASMTAGIGFTATWFAVGIVVCLAIWAAGGWLDGAALGEAERHLAGASLIVAALYQASPLARSCQRACARPFGILARSWHGAGTPCRDAFMAGLRYGMSCVGCCVPMIVVMMLVGVHDLGWMAGLALVMMMQKHAVWGPRIMSAAAVALTVAGLGIGAGWWVVPLHSLRALCGV